MKKFNKEEIIDLIGESTEYDKKAELEEKDPESWLKSVSAFANTNGGALLFGIDDDDNIIGVRNAKAVGDKLSDYINNYIEPHPITDLQYETFNDADGKHDVAILYVYPGGQTPYYYSHRRAKRAYMRMPNSSVPADKPFLDKLVLKGSNMTYNHCRRESPLL